MSICLQQLLLLRMLYTGSSAGIRHQSHSLLLPIDKENIPFQVNTDIYIQGPKHHMKIVPFDNDNEDIYD